MLERQRESFRKKFIQPNSVTKILSINRLFWLLKDDEFDNFLNNWTASIGSRLKMLRGDLSTTPKISVVVPARDEEKYILVLLESLARQKKITGFGGLETILVLNDCKKDDRTLVFANRIKRYGGEALRIITYSNIKPGGIALARQVGLRNANGEIVVSTDADVVTLPEWLNLLTAPLADPNVTCTLGYYNHYDRSSARFQYLDDPARVISKTFLAHTPILKQHNKLLFTTGQNMAFRRQEALDIGGYDIRKVISEDADMGERLGQIGKLALITDSRAIIWASPRRLKHAHIWQIIAKDLRMNSVMRSFYLDENSKLTNYR